ncbi:hypothetical protein Tco_1450868 [Tanacetum coccineum]
MGKTCVSGRFARLQEVRFNFDQKDQETPRIVGDDSARSEPMEVADSNNFKPLLKEKRKEGRIRWPRNTVKTLLGLHNATTKEKEKTTTALERDIIARIQGLTNGEEEAIRDCYRRFIDMIKVYHETARCPRMRSQEEKWEKRPTRQTG